MPEPTTTSTATWSFATWVALYFGVQLSIINPHTLMGAVGGGLVYLVFEQGSPAFRRFIGAFVSVVMGYIAEPEFMRHTGIEAHGIGSFVVSALLIVATVFVMSLIKSGRIMDFFNRGKS